MTFKNPATARRYAHGDTSDVPPSLTPGHLDARSTQAAAKIAARALHDGGTLLGSGNFGAIYAVGNALVKLPTTHDIHGRRRSEREQREDFVHEVGVANELQALGFRVVPRSIYVEVDGTPTIVREFGQIPAGVTPREYDALGDQLFKVLEAGWNVRDDLLVARRPDRSLFVADVGVWFPMRPGRDFHSDRAGAPEELERLLRKFSGEQPWIAPLIPDEDRERVARGGYPTPALWGIPTARELRNDERTSKKRLYEAKGDGFTKRALRDAERTRESIAVEKQRRALVGLR